MFSEIVESFITAAMKTEGQSNHEPLTGTVENDITGRNDSPSRNDENPPRLWLPRDRGSLKSMSVVARATMKRGKKRERRIACIIKKNSPFDIIAMKFIESVFDLFNLNLSLLLLE